MADKFIWLFFRFSGRIGRQAYLLATLLLVIVSVFLTRGVMLINGNDIFLADENLPLSAISEAVTQAIWVTLPIVVWPHIALGVKRSHDFGKEGILAVLLFVPVVSFLAFIAFIAIPSEPGPNRYGRWADAPDDGGG